MLETLEQNKELLQFNAEGKTPLSILQEACRDSSCKRIFRKIFEGYEDR